MQITYARASAEDIENIYTFCVQLIDAYEDKTAVDYDKILRWVRRKIESCIAEYTAVYADGNKAGYYHFYQNEDGEMELDDLYIFPAYQRQGIGTKILQECCAAAKKSVRLYVFIKNERAVALYRRLGFTVVETVGNTRYIMKKEV